MGVGPGQAPWEASHMSPTFCWVDHLQELTSCAGGQFSLSFWLPATSQEAEGGVGGQGREKNALTELG